MRRAACVAPERKTKNSRVAPERKLKTSAWRLNANSKERLNKQKNSRRISSPAIFLPKIHKQLFMLRGGQRNS